MQVRASAALGADEAGAAASTGDAGATPSSGARAAVSAEVQGGQQEDFGKRLPTDPN